MLTLSIGFHWFPLVFIGFMHLNSRLFLISHSSSLRRMLSVYVTCSCLDAPLALLSVWLLGCLAVWLFIEQRCISPSMCLFGCKSVLEIIRLYVVLPICLSLCSSMNVRNRASGVSVLICGRSHFLQNDDKNSERGKIT